ncbi:hypothetical protein [Paramaledivibacter caminithermalis]|nr:hypothetical protein [Paramaledivibacter caminithermalis]
MDWIVVVLNNGLKKYVRSLKVIKSEFATVSSKLIEILESPQED